MYLNEVLCQYGKAKIFTKVAWDEKSEYVRKIMSDGLYQFILIFSIIYIKY